MSERQQHMERGRKAAISPNIHANTQSYSDREIVGLIIEISFHEETFLFTFCHIGSSLQPHMKVLFVCVPY